MSILDKLDEIELDEIKLRKMRYKIYSLERENYLAKRYTNPEMRNKIRTIIIEEYRKNVGG